MDVFRVGQHDDHPYVAMKLLTGQSLRERFQMGSRFEIDELLCDWLDNSLRDCPPYIRRN